MEMRYGGVQRESTDKLMEALQTAGVEIDYIGGLCPCQSEGVLDGRRFYFRARHDHVEFCISELNAEDDEHILNPVWRGDWQWGDPGNEGAGYIDIEDALHVIAYAVGAFRFHGHEFWR